MREVERQKTRRTDPRGAETRVRIAQALVDLLCAGDPEPSAGAIAERAGVSRRLLFYHFETIEALYRLATERHVERAVRALAPVRGDGACGARVARIVDQHTRAHEALAPIRRSTVARLSSSRVGACFSVADTAFRVRVQESFGPELAAEGPVGSRSAGGIRCRAGGGGELLHALCAAGSWETWSYLRDVQGRNLSAARRAVRRTMTSLLA